MVPHKKARLHSSIYTYHEITEIIPRTEFNICNDHTGFCRKKNQCHPHKELVYVLWDHYILLAMPIFSMIKLKSKEEREQPLWKPLAILIVLEIQLSRETFAFIILNCCMNEQKVLPLASVCKVLYRERDPGQVPCSKEFDFCAVS